MKFTLPLLALAALLSLGFSACTTLANRRDLYSPTKANGPYTRSLQDGSWRDNDVKPVDEERAEKAAAPHSS